MWSINISTIRQVLGMKPRVVKEESYVLYQNLCDDVFGARSVTIKRAPDNNVIGAFRYLDDFTEFKKNFRRRLVRLRKRFEGTPSYSSLLEQVKQVADPKNWEGAYAELAAYDVMWNDYVMTPLELDKTLLVTDSYAGEMGYKATNEDGYVPDYGLYFDVKILADTVRSILKGIIDEAIKNSAQTVSCDILPEYPVDDDDEEYGGANRRLLLNELTVFLKTNNTEKKGKKLFRSRVIPRLAYRVLWGGGVNTAIHEYDPYRHAEEMKHLVFKRYTKKIMKNEMFVLVLVKFPWYNNLVTSFVDADHVFYRSLARRTFCEYLNAQTLMSTIVPKFVGKDTVDEVSKHLAGIVFIDDNIVKEDSYSCNVILNPNAVNTHEIARDYLMHLVQKGDKRGSFDDLRHDNY